MCLMNQCFIRIQRGHSLLPCHRLQKGQGLGALLGSFIKIAKPFIQKGISYITKQGKSFVMSKAVKDLAQSGKKQLIKSGQNVIADVIEGKNLKDSLQNELQSQKHFLEKEVHKARKRVTQKVRLNEHQFKKWKVKCKNVVMQMKKDIFS